ncbi:syncollin-like isoform X1 [Alosa sapidissima]|uniref:syncollin-like isoform X1 n=1 Tax=Alosa sapidissima TaxID=34773 RepID=UPI001C092C45|nr:syncollin-like isoform X1 [Alosa sapidissima]XP_041948613.1 syncollin-like isoform X1 [Alosa sapidissima]
MKSLAAVLVCVALCWEGLNAECPEPTALKDANGGKLCARLFTDSHYVFAQSCGGASLDVFPGDDVPTIDRKWNNRVSSLVVARSCSLTVWDYAKKGGTKRKFSTGIQYQLKDVPKGLFGNWNDDISAYYCTC